MAPADSALAGKTVLVSGAGGFIGSHLVERLVALASGDTAEAAVSEATAGEPSHA